jgi:ABC-2 type transport system ATP-binding protein
MPGYGQCRFHHASFEKKPLAHERDPRVFGDSRDFVNGVPITFFRPVPQRISLEVLGRMGSARPHAKIPTTLGNGCLLQEKSSMALTITGLSKTYPNGVRALKNVSLAIGNNMFGLLGPNGAGKSSLMRTVATLQDPDSGAITLDGIDVLAQKNEVRKILGYLPQEFGVYPKLSAVDMLNHLAVLKGVTASGERKEMVEALLQQTNLWEVRKKSLSTYSGGMKQRFGIAQALLANPRLIIVDEPTAGLDPAERNRFLNLLASIGREVTVILSTHIVDDVRELCSRMAIIASGEVLLEGVPSETLAALEGQIWSRIVATDDELRALETEFQVVSTHLTGGQHEIRVFAASSPGAGFRPVAAGLEDVYFLHLSRHSKN